MNKTTKLIGILALLSGVTLLLLFWDRDSQQDIPEIHLASNTQIVSINISNSENIQMSQQADVWTVNNEFAMDDNLAAITSALFEKVRIKRGLDGAEKEEIEQLMESKSSKVLLTLSDGETKAWKLVGKPEHQKTFLKFDNELYEIHLPGYESYIAGLFEMTANDWRSKKAYQGTIQSLYKMKVSTATDSFSIQYQTPFYQVNGIEAFDTLAFVTQLEASANWRINQWENPANPSSLQKTLVINLEDINPMFNAEWILYKSTETPENYWIQINQKEWASININQFNFWMNWKSGLKKN